MMKRKDECCYMRIKKNYSLILTKSDIPVSFERYPFQSLSNGVFTTKVFFNFCRMKLYIIFHLGQNKNIKVYQIY